MTDSNFTALWPTDPILLVWKWVTTPFQCTLAVEDIGDLKPLSEFQTWEIQMGLGRFIFIKIDKEGSLKEKKERMKMI